MVESRREDAFASFVAASEPRLRRALVATYGPTVGREPTVDALSWAWEHWDRLQPMANPVGYLYRVGQTRAREARARSAAVAEFDTGAVLLVHGYGLSVRDAAETLNVSVSTLRVHVERALARLRAEIGEVV
jgi:DNA-directed RNA polymerase specialized sigma24 family protein